MYALTFAYLVSPVHLYCLAGTFLFSFFCFLFFIFYSLFFTCTKNAKKEVSEQVTFPSWMFFKRIFYFCSLICVLYFCLVAFLCFLRFWYFWYFWCFWCFWSVREFKTALITSFILLLKFILLQAWIFLITIFFNYHNIFQLSQSFSIITIFFNYHNLF